MVMGELYVANLKFKQDMRRFVMDTAMGFRRIKVEKVDDVTVVRFKDEKIIKSDQVREIGDELKRLVEELGADKILVSFLELDFMCSLALQKMVALDRTVKACGGVLKLSNVRPEIYEVLAITKLNRLFDIKDDEADALAAF